MYILYCHTALHYWHCKISNRSNNSTFLNQSFAQSPRKPSNLSQTKCCLPLSLSVWSLAHSECISGLFHPLSTLSSSLDQCNLVWLLQRQQRLSSLSLSLCLTQLTLSPAVPSHSSKSIRVFNSLILWESTSRNLATVCSLYCGRYIWDICGKGCFALFIYESDIKYRALIFMLWCFDGDTFRDYILKRDLSFWLTVSLGSLSEW